jgi:hypothetical protein
MRIPKSRVLNKYFVAIKVDREERPDVDRLYIAYLESISTNAGWPLNVFLTSRETGRVVLGHVARRLFRCYGIGHRTSGEDTRILRRGRARAQFGCRDEFASFG